MKYPAAILDEIKERLSASSVIGRHVKIQKAGREWKGLSPFNAEKSPSFYVNDQKQFWHDFSSGKSGDIFTFLMETQGLSFPEAVEKLAAEAGVALPKSTPQAIETEQRLKTLYDVMALATQFFQRQLQEPHGKFARDYLVKRGLTQATQREFKIGYAPESRTELINFLRGEGVNQQQMIDAGLAIQPDEYGREPYDRFRDRLMIPIEDLKGRVIAFGGRALKPDAQPKYLNSPETELFKKGQTLFNAHRARASAFKVRSMIVVEGYMDAIAVAQAGMQGVVATLGTAFTPEQINALWRLAPEPVICFDGDRAGREAAYKALDRILPVLNVGYSFKFSFLPNGKDPDDVLRDDGIDAFKRLIDQALPFWDVLWRSQVEQANLSTPDGQAVLEKRLEDKMRTISCVKLRVCYFRVIKTALWELRRKPKLVITTRALQPVAQHAKEHLIIALISQDYDVFCKYCERLAAIGFQSAKVQDWFTHLHDYTQAERVRLESAQSLTHPAQVLLSKPQNERLLALEEMILRLEGRDEEANALINGMELFS